MSKTTVLQIWDVWVRLFHWSLAASVLFLMVSGETGLGFFEWHRQVGEFVLMLIFFRLCWGIFGSENARLHALIQSPRAAVEHLVLSVNGRVSQERGHNAAGGWAVVALLLLCTVQAVSGLFIADEDEFLEGVFYAAVSSETSDWLYRVHHLNAELLQVLVAVHVLMVLFYLLRVGQNLIRPMITGQMQWRDSRKAPEVQFAAWWKGLAVLVVCASIVAFVLGWPPL